jgi:hypothetical protein
MTAPWRPVFPGTWSPSDAAFSSKPPGNAIKEAMLGAGDSSLSLSLAATEGADTASGAVALRIALALSVTDGADACSASMLATIQASMAATEGADSASAGLQATIQAALNATEGADTAASTLALLILASLDVTEGADLCAATCEIASESVDLSLDATEGADLCASEMALQAAQAEQDRTGGGGLYRQVRGSIRIEDDDEIKDGFQRDKPLVPPSVVTEIKPPAVERKTNRIDKFAPVSDTKNEPISEAISPENHILNQAKRRDAALRILLLAA